MNFGNSLHPERIIEKLTTRWLGYTIHLYHQLDSTNLTAIELAQRGAPEGTVVIADQQLRGRGRGERSWHSPAGVGIYCSMLLRPKLVAARAQLLTLMTGVAVARAVSEVTDLSPRIKWPNDILLNAKKIAGVLLESKSSGTDIEHAIIGVGINVNHTPADLPELLLMGASSLRVELGKRVERNALISQLFVEMEGLYESLQREDSAVILAEWCSLTATLGERVQVMQGDKPIRGTAVDITDEGALLLQTEGNTPLVVHAGNVEHLKITTGD